MTPKVAIIYLSYHSEPYLNDVISALKKITYPKDRIELVIVDNPHPTFGSSVPFIESSIEGISGTEIPHVTILPQEKNLGFSGGNNVGIQWALDNDFDYVYLHNNDGFVAANFLEPLIETAEKDKTIGELQSLVLLYPETNLINTSGNSFHYLAMGYCNNFRVPKEQAVLPKVAETTYASGAAVLLRADLLRKFGLWDEDFFLYHEDIEYSLRLRAAGYKVVAVSDSIFFHKYSFGRNAQKFYFIERNRIGVMLMYYKWATLLLLAPIGIIFECGLLLFAAKQGWLKTKLSAYAYWLMPNHWVLWLKKRRMVQSIRTVTDKSLLATATSSITFDDQSIQNPLLTYIGNPLMTLYWWVVKKLIAW